MAEWKFNSPGQNSGVTRERNLVGLYLDWVRPRKLVPNFAKWYRRRRS